MEARSFRPRKLGISLARSAACSEHAKRKRRTIKASRSRSCVSSGESSLVPSSRNVADGMVNLYIQFFDPIFRVFHVPTFWAEYQRYWKDVDSSPTSLRIKVLLVIAIGSSLSDHGTTDSNFTINAFGWITAAETWLAGPLKKDRLTHQRPPNILSDNTRSSDLLHRRRSGLDVRRIAHSQSHANGHPS